VLIFVMQEWLCGEVPSWLWLSGVLIFVMQGRLRKSAARHQWLCD
jgi:hypothetical protein